MLVSIFFVCGCSNDVKQEYIKCNAAQDKFEELVSNLKMNFDLEMSKAKSEKDAAKNEFSLQRAKDKIEKLDDVLDKVVRKCKTGKERVADFVGIVKSINNNGCIVVVHSNYSYYLNLPENLLDISAFSSKNDKVFFSGIINGELSRTRSGFFEAPEWIVNVEKISNEQANARVAEADTKNQQKCTTIEELRPYLNRFESVLKKIKGNDFCEEYLAKHWAKPIELRLNNYVVEFEKIQKESINPHRNGLGLFAYSGEIIPQLINVGIELAYAKEVVGYSGKRDGIKFYFPLYVGREVFKSEEEKNNYTRMFNRVANDNFGKGDKLKFTGKVSFVGVDNGHPTLAAEPGFVLIP